MTLTNDKPCEAPAFEAGSCGRTWAMGTHGGLVPSHVFASACAVKQRSDVMWQSREGRHARGVILWSSPSDVGPGLPAAAPEGHMFLRTVA